jgi:type II secretory ATPase GspE/PulE/Tfp pilus assembly ATPase PilB-like protein
LIAAVDEPELRTSSLEAGADDFLIVPFGLTELRAKLKIASTIVRAHNEGPSVRQTGSTAADSSDGHRPEPLGSILVSLGLIDPETLRNALAEQAKTGERLGRILQSNNWATEEDVTRARSIQLEVPYCNVLEEETDPYLLSQVPHNTAKRYQMLPLPADRNAPSRDGRPRVAMVNPGDIEAIDLLQHRLKSRIDPLLASPEGVRAAIEKAYRYAENKEEHSSLQGHGTVVVANAEDEDFVSDDVDIAEEMRRSDEAPVVAFVNSVLTDAVRRRASDIHIEPRKKDFQILYRMDGQLQPVRTASKQFFAATISRLKIMAELDISERRLPQDGRIAVKVEDRPIDLRVSTLPTQYGERVVLRILDRSGNTLELSRVGLSTEDMATFKSLLQKPHGLVLVTGPTGSGKTTTLYAALNAIKEMATNGGTGRRNIITCEDPIEYELEGISQSAVHEKAGLTFAKQLRAILRQDPDVVLVGEIRDAETAEIAFRAALTGHLVLSTLHCNEAAGAISRLMDMGLPPYLIASALSGVIAQRLARRLCPNCREKYRPEDNLLEAVSPFTDTTEFYRPIGCSQCDGTGTKGRTSVHEIMIVDTKIRHLIKEAADTSTVRKAAVAAGMNTLIDSGLRKAAGGEASLDEILFKVGLPETENRPNQSLLRVI